MRPRRPECRWWPTAGQVTVRAGRNPDEGHDRHEMSGLRDRPMGAARRFLGAFSMIPPHLRPRRHLLTAPGHRTEMIIRIAIRDRAAGTTRAAGLPAAA